MSAYYNENDAYAAQWLRNLIHDGLIAPGHVDDRSIRDVAAADLAGFVQCHFFAGIGIWSYALRAAGWPDNRPVWTGSCPCQPFSGAGKRQGIADERHLWPVWFPLIEQCCPAIVFGEQVAGKDGRGWWDIVSPDLEAAGYACGVADLAAAGVGAPHIRQRLYWVADASGEGLPACERGTVVGTRWGYQGGTAEQRGGASADGLVDALGDPRHGDERRRAVLGPADAIDPAGGLANAHRGRLPEPWWGSPGRDGQRSDSASLGDDGLSGPLNGYWRAADWLRCTDGKWRAVEPASFPLANGYPARVVRLRAYGNAICAPLAVEFIQAYMDCCP